jgi:hypothetical protein
MPQETIRILKRLCDVHQMSNDQFRRVHHFSASGKSTTTIKRHLNYCRNLRTNEFSGDTNVRTRQRLHIVLDEKDRGATWEQALGAALKKYPLP